MHDADLSMRRLADLQQVGVQLAVDDFGTGYSSLGYMEQFPVDILKIDRSFVDGLGVRQATPVLQSIIELAQRLGVHIVAEGIERREQLEALQQLGCDLGQGYFFSGPGRGRPARRPARRQPHRRPPLPLPAGRQRAGLIDRGWNGAYARDQSRRRHLNLGMTSSPISSMVCMTASWGILYGLTRQSSRSTPASS